VDLLPQGIDSPPGRKALSSFDHEMRTDNISAIFGQVLREQRNSRGLSQEDLALSANVDRTFVSQMERGIRQPSITTLIKLSGALGVQPSVLVARVERLLR
jgi:ribosome-binding protein aMBF1 (putative translation factor)